MSAYQASVAVEARELAEQRDRAFRGGFIVFLFSESMFFVSLFAIRFVMAGAGHPSSLNQALAGVLTLVMVASLVPATKMRRAATRGAVPAIQRMAGLTALAGVALLAGVGWEWHRLSLGPQGRFGGIYYLSVGMDALHVFIAVVMLLAVIGRARSGEFTARSHFSVEAAQLFWYLVASMWLAMWAVFYLA